MCGKLLGPFFGKFAKDGKSTKIAPAKGAREARPFVAGAMFCTFSIFLAIFPKTGAGSFPQAALRLCFIIRRRPRLLHRRAPQPVTLFYRRSYLPRVTSK